jgi:hypothetical protein
MKTKQSTPQAPRTTKLQRTMQAAGKRCRKEHRFSCQ